VLFDPRGSRRSRWRVPRWLVLLLCGTFAGAAAVIIVQQRYMPPRLSAAESTALRRAFEQADGERQQLKAQLTNAQQQLQLALEQKTAAGEALASSRTLTERLREDLAAVVQALPPDPRGGSVEVRAGQFNVRDGALDYQVVLLREGGARKPLAGVLQFTVSGESVRGTPATLALQPIALTMGSHEVMRGSVPLPDGFKPRQTTVQVLDRTGGKALGMRVLLVR
jgi:hypothetical protein